MCVHVCTCAYMCKLHVVCVSEFAYAFSSAGEQSTKLCHRLKAGPACEVRSHQRRPQDCQHPVSEHPSILESVFLSCNLPGNPSIILLENQNILAAPYIFSPRSCDKKRKIVAHRAATRRRLIHTTPTKYSRYNFLAVSASSAGLCREPGWLPL